MKKITSLLLVCVLLVGCVFALASCSMRIGKYGGEVNFGGFSYEVYYDFQGTGVEITTIKETPFTAPDTNVYKGTFEITGDGDEKKITFDLETEGSFIKSGTFDYAEGSDENGNYIKINGVRFSVKNENDGE